ncbi:MAG: hypothetical protein P8Y27_05385, partial [Chromatiaceae bacterium]
MRQPAQRLCSIQNLGSTAIETESLRAPAAYVCNFEDLSPERGSEKDEHNQPRWKGGSLSMSMGGSKSVSVKDYAEFPEKVLKEG